MKLPLIISALSLLLSFILVMFNQIPSALTMFMISMWCLYGTIFSIIEKIEDKKNE